MFSMEARRRTESAARVTPSWHHNSLNMFRDKDVSVDFENAKNLPHESALPHEFTASCRSLPHGIRPCFATLNTHSC